MTQHHMQMCQCLPNFVRSLTCYSLKERVIILSPTPVGLLQLLPQLALRRRERFHRHDIVRSSRLSGLGELARCMHITLFPCLLGCLEDVLTQLGWPLGCQRRSSLPPALYIVDVALYRLVLLRSVIAHHIHQ